MLVVILAGGKSRRMGRDKALLPFRGTTLLAYMVEQYRAAGFDVAISQRRVPGLPVLYDEFPGCGPMAGLHAAFAQTEAEEIFLTAIDLPLAGPELAEVLLRRAAPEDTACVIRRTDGRVEPLFGLYRRASAAPAAALLSRGRFQMLQLLEAVSAHFLLESDLEGFDLERRLLNVNTPEIYEILNS